MKIENQFPNPLQSTKKKDRDTVVWHDRCGEIFFSHKSLVDSAKIHTFQSILQEEGYHKAINRAKLCHTYKPTIKFYNISFWQTIRGLIFLLIY